MWLDRLSGHSTPAVTPSVTPAPTTNRAYSPAPRRTTSHLGPASAAQRPGFNPRSSSLSVHSNDSTTSLLASSRRPNGSGLKQSLAVLDAPNPLSVLEKLLGNDEKKVSETGAPDVVVNGTKVSGEEDEFELDFDGLSLRELVLGDSAGVREDNVYTQTIEECMLHPT